MLREKKQRCHERAQQTAIISHMSFVGQSRSALQPKACGPPYQGSGSSRFARRMLQDHTGREGPLSICGEGFFGGRAHMEMPKGM